MTGKITFIKISTLTLFLLMLYGCFGGDGGLKYRKAEFNRDPQELLEDLKKIQNFENADIKWRARQFGDSTTQVLEVYLINGQNISPNDSLRKELSRTAMKTALLSIDNDTAYDSFVVFINSSTKEGMMQMNTSQAYEFTLNELK